MKTQKQPGPLSQTDKKNFNTLLRAIKNNDVALISAIRKSDGKQVSLICAMECDGNYYYPKPFAVMIEGNPYELYEDPTLVGLEDDHETA